MENTPRKLTKTPGPLACFTGNYEWYTPPEIVEAARDVLGRIDLDPASTDIANEVVRAAVYYTKEQDGLAQAWRGKVWLNPPYAYPLIAKFVEKLILHYMAGEVPEACMIANAGTCTRWFQRLARVAAAICFPSGQVKFWGPKAKPGRRAPLPSAIFYLGPNVERFCERFSSFGVVMSRLTK